MRILRLAIFLAFLALAAPKTIQAQQPQTYEQTMKSAIERFNDKDYLSAKTYLELALRLKPGDPTATRRLNETISLIQKQMQEQETFYKHMDEGDKLLATGKDDEALAAYRKALQVFPNDRYVVGQVEKITRKREEALQNQRDFDQALQRGRQFLDNGRYEEAILQFGQAIEIFPNNTDAKALLQQAEKDLALLRDKETNFQRLMALARNQMNRRNYLDAKARAEEALNLFPQNIDAIALRDEANKMIEISTKYEAVIAQADLAYQNKQLAQARNLYAEAQKIWPEQGFATDMIRRIDETLNSEAYQSEELISVLLNEASDAFDKQNLKLALEKYNKVLEIKPDHTLAGRRSAELTFALREQQKKAEEQALYERLMSEGNAFEQKADLMLAKAAYQKALEAKPGDAQAQFKLEFVSNKILAAEAAKNLEERYLWLMTEGRKLLISNDISQALIKFNEALSLKPGDAEATAEVNKTEILMREAHAQNALESRFNALIHEADEAFAKALYKAAETAYAEAAALKPSESYPRERVKLAQENYLRQEAELAAGQQYALLIKEADQLFAQQDFSRAAELYTQASALKPLEKLPVDQLGKITEILNNQALKKETEERINKLMAQGNELMNSKSWTEAINTFVQVINLDPGNGSALSRKAEAELAIERERKEAQQRYEQSIVEADRQMGLNNYQEAIAAYKAALGYKQGDDYAKQRISQAEAIILERLTSMRKEYNRIIAEADRNFNARNFDKAIELYMNAENTNPAETYPRQMISRIAELFEQNKVRDVVSTSITLNANTNRRLTFEPLDVADRRASYVIIKARNLSNGNFPLLVQFGSNNARNGGFVLPIPDNQEANDFIVHIGAQYRWFSEDNNWLELIPENGNVEISLIRISKQ
jgi:tetratricopeptide (TPR) repeat protein